MRAEEKLVLKLLDIDETFLQKKAVGLPAQQVRKGKEKSSSMINHLVESEQRNYVTLLRSNDVIRSIQKQKFLRCRQILESIPWCRSKPLFSTYFIRNIHSLF